MLGELLNQGSGSPAQYSFAIIGAAVAILPLIALVLFLQRFWGLDLVSRGVKGCPGPTWTTSGQLTD
jgi:multiple sugar transport system permease protein